MAKKVKTKPRPTTAKRKPVTTTALARRTPPKPKPAIVLPAVLTDNERNLSDEIMLGGLGLVDIKLTPAEEAILSEPINVKDISVKPTGQPYLSHPVYTRWFGRAFGRLGFALVPVSKPAKAITGKKVSVVVPYVLYIHGQPAAFANGEQDYYDDNAEQTYGDALESTVASGLRRCAKRLGVGLEMWDRVYLENFIERHCVRVQIKQKNGELKWIVRRKDAEPFYNEVGRSRRRDESNEPRKADVVPAEERASHAAEGEKITLQQRQRIAMIVNNSDRSDYEVNEWLRDAYGIRNDKPTRDVLRRDYDAICRALEAPGRLPAGRA